jgi:hypothetical protein
MSCNCKLQVINVQSKKNIKLEKRMKLLDRLIVFSYKFLCILFYKLKLINFENLTYQQLDKYLIDDVSYGKLYFENIIWKNK